MCLKKYPPTYLGDMFTCPHCHVAITQKWFTMKKSQFFDEPVIKAVPLHSKNVKEIRCFTSDEDTQGIYDTFIDWNIEFSICDSCRKYVIWENKGI